MLTASEHDWTTFGCCGCGKSYEVAKSCGNRFCDVCAQTKRKRATDRIKHVIKSIGEVRGMRRKMITLTIRNMDSLDGMVKRLTSAFRKMRNRQFWKNKVHGGIYVIEVTGRPGNWHAHLHIICQTYYLRQSEIAKHWQSITKDSFVVWISNISGAHAMRYCTKYLSKPMSVKDGNGEQHDLPDSVIDLIGEALRNRRMFQVFGSFFALSRTYQKPSSACPTCGCTDFAPDFLMRRMMEGSWKATNDPLPARLTEAEIDAKAIQQAGKTFIDLRTKTIDVDEELPF